jgi:SAM-dependent methyltransferase
MLFPGAHRSKSDTGPLASQQPRSEFDQYRSTYADAVNTSIAFSGLDVDYFTRAKATRLLDALALTVGSTQNLSVLDVGCGVGNYHPLLKGKVGRLTGVDPSSECIAEARAKNPEVRYAVSDGDHIPFNEGEFDAAYAICVMHHVPPAKWELFAAELVRVTKPGGLVIIFEHNPYNPLTRRAVSTCPFDEDAVLLSKRKTTAYLRGAGLTSIVGKYILTIPSVDGPLRRIDDALGALPLGAQYYVCGRR